MVVEHLKLIVITQDMSVDKVTHKACHTEQQTEPTEQIQIDSAI